MTNADKFKETFGIYATELWAMPGADFPKWLSAESNTETRAKRREEMVEVSEQELTRLKKHEESYYKLKKKRKIYIPHWLPCLSSYLKIWIITLYL